jgi:hypothetical protein
LVSKKLICNLKQWKFNSISIYCTGHHQLGNSREMAWENTSQHLGSARQRACSFALLNCLVTVDIFFACRHPNSALYAQFRREGKEKQWGSF